MSNTATDEQMIQWLRLRTRGDEWASSEQRAAVTIAERLQAQLDELAAQLAAANARAEVAEVKHRRLIVAVALALGETEETASIVQNEALLVQAVALLRSGEMLPRG